MSTHTVRRIALASAAGVIVILGALAWLSREPIWFFLAFESLGPNAQGYAEFRHRQTGIVFASLPGDGADVRGRVARTRHGFSSLL